MTEYMGSDLACECLPRENAKKTEGIRSDAEQSGGFSVLRVSICSDKAAKEVGKARGEYVSVECGRMDRLGGEERQALSRVIAKELRRFAVRLTKNEIDADLCVLAVGLGNARLTADAIGPMTVQGLTATRHLREHEETLYRALGCASLSTLIPGVLGETGIETLEILRGTVQATRPHLVLLIDALCARECERLASTVQLSDTGIAPGTGVGNHRCAIDRDSLGVPVISLGVPTVVNSATLVYDALKRAGLEEAHPSVRQVLESGERLYVSPKESDMIVLHAAEILSFAIDHAFTASLSKMLS